MVLPRVVSGVVDSKLCLVFGCALEFDVRVGVLKRVIPQRKSSGVVGEI